LDLWFKKKQRNPNNDVRYDQDMVLAMFTDPRVKNILKSTAAVQSLRVSPELASITQIKDIHFKYFTKYSEKNRGSTSTGAAEGQDDDDSQFDDEFLEDDLEMIVDGELEVDVDGPAQSAIDARKESDVIVDTWLGLKVNFQDVASHQNSDFNKNLTVTKKRRNADGSVSQVQMYKVDALYNHIDILQWWKENEHAFPTIALMARVYLSRELTSCFQERVFSAAGFVGNKLRTCTLDHREEKLCLSKVNRDTYAQLKRK
jgi:hypothetical protein